MITAEKIPDYAKKLEQIFELISEGKSMRKSCEQLQISGRTFYELMDADKNGTLEKRYASARKKQAAWHFSRIVEIADKVESGELDPNAGRVAADVRKWVAARLHPVEFGEKTQVEMSGSVGLTHSGSVTLTVEQRLARLRAAQVDEVQLLP